MKLATMLGMILFTSSVSAQTVINYEDGSTYTLNGREEIYISSKDNIYSLTGTTSKVMRLYKEIPWTKRDYQPEPVTGDELCWAWAGVAPPPGYSYEACRPDPEPEDVECNPDGLSFGGC
jgi:hypothetical protein